MTATSTKHVDSELDAVRAGQVRLLYESLPLALIAVVACGVMLAIVQSRVLPQLQITAWLSVLVLVTLLRAASYLAYRRSPARNTRLWASLALAGAMGSGLVWGSASLLLFPAGDFAHQAFLALAIAGMSAGAVTTLSARAGYAMAFVLPATLPLSLAYLAQGQYPGYASAMLILLFSTMLAAISVRLSESIRDSLTARYRHEQAEQTVRRQAFYDDLTGLPNRRLLIDHLNMALAVDRREHLRGGLLFLDLDRFKYINDSLGHHVGDGLLEVVAERLRGRIREGDTAARLGGDEFVVLLPDIGGSKEQVVDKLYAVAHDLQDLLRQPIHSQNHQLHVDASIGIADFNGGHYTAAEILRRADMALHAAKAKGRGTAQFFLPEMQQLADRRLDCERGLRDALARDELELFFQLQVDYQGRPTGAEALVRWHHPERGLVPPDEFIPIAEDSGLILPIGAWALRSACARLAEIDPASLAIIAVNVSPRQFRDPGFVDLVADTLSTFRVAPGRLQLEITEGTVMEDIDAGMRKLVALKELGVSLALDDFGTGYSSLAYLKALPVDLLKISGCFIHDIASNASDARIVEAIIVLAQRMGMGVIAEGVESDEVTDFLTDHGCLHFQGYHFARPEPFAALLRRLSGLPQSSVRRVPLRLYEGKAATA